MKLIEIHLTQIAQQLYGCKIKAELTRPNLEFGDYSTNLAMRLAGRIGRPSLEVAQELSEELNKIVGISSSVAGPGFINIKLSDNLILETWNAPINLIYKDKTVVVEYSDPNPFKVLHAGHLYTSVVGDAIANLVETAGGKVYRVNFGGDVGLHVGKTMWAIVHSLGGEYPSKLTEIEVANQANWLAENYVIGTNAYENDLIAKQEIIEINKRIYSIQEQQDKISALAQIYWTCRKWSYDYFDAFYVQIGSHFDKYYPESATAKRGLEEVCSRVGTVFTKSEGAIIFEGEKYGLHNRVFINSQGLPTYETKDVGLIFCKYDDYKFDQSIIITADEQKQYMQVVLKALDQFAPVLAQATTHITHGIVKLVGGIKMSSRKGNFLRAIDVLDYARKANLEQNKANDDRVALGAVKYAFLKPRIGGDIIYDPKESVSLIGNSGPYLQYAHARACSILKKSNKILATDLNFDVSERPLAVKLGEFAEVVNEATKSLMPHLICTYLYELAQEFNRFYEHSQIIGNDREQIRLALVNKYITLLARGLIILGITPLEEM